MNNGSSRYTVNVVRDYLNTVSVVRDYLLKETLNCLEIHCLEFYRTIHRNSGLSYGNLELLNHLDVISKRMND